MGKWIPPVGVVIVGGLTDANVGEFGSLGLKSMSSSSGYDGGGGLEEGYAMMMMTRARLLFFSTIPSVVVVSDSHILCQTHTYCVNLTHPVLKLTHSIKGIFTQDV
jgi:hypothetical protein